MKTQMVDLKRSKTERAKENTPAKMEVDDYPYGLRVHLDHETLEKLGVKTLPKAGDKLHIRAEGHVKSVEESHRDGGKKNRSMSIELRKMAIAATDRAAKEPVKEGDLRGALAAMDQALDAKENPGKKGAKDKG